jgi:Tol biopolymer transport system component
LGKFLAVPGLLLGIALFLSQWDRVRSARSQVPPPMGQAIRDVVVAGTSTTEISRLNGWVVWSSNRFGNHDILKMNLADRSIHRLTEHPHAESFPRISPDGRKIIFARSRQPWVSLRNPIPWDVYLLDLESGSERLLAEFGNAPTWSTDGSLAYFQRRGS